MNTFEEAVRGVIELAAFCGQKGWLPATSGNLSVLVDKEPLQIAITRSGADKAHLQKQDVLLIDGQMNVLNSDKFKPSAETSVHVELYQTISCGSIVHVHTVFNNLISELHGDDGYVEIADHELLKALGHWDEGAKIRIPIVPNWADLTKLGYAVRDAAQPDVPAVLVRNHGVYAWGDSVFSALRHLEAFEFLCEYLYRLRLVRGR